MQATSQKAIIKDMSPPELQEHADSLYAKCDGNILLLSEDEHNELKLCATEYYYQTGEALQPASNLSFQFS